ncbi:MAG: hypothetical protein U5M50_08685 [Sphingobium sp.]|nr:hypothetical protein [Sphingobium sp.]
MSDRLDHELLALLGDAAFIAFTEAFGGQRLYVPKSIGPDHEITRLIGAAAAHKLSARYCPAVLAGARLRPWLIVRAIIAAIADAVQCPDSLAHFRMPETRRRARSFSRMDVKPARKRVCC